MQPSWRPNGDSTLKQASRPALRQQSMSSLNVDLPFPIYTLFSPHDQPPIKFGLTLQPRPISAAFSHRGGDAAGEWEGRGMRSSVRPLYLYIGLLGIARWLGQRLALELRCGHRAVVECERSGCRVIWSACGGVGAVTRLRLTTARETTIAWTAYELIFIVVGCWILWRSVR